MIRNTNRTRSFVHPLDGDDNERFKRRVHYGEEQFLARRSKGHSDYRA